MATYYVSTTGDNITGDGSLGNPWRTPEYGSSQLSASDTLRLRVGTYNATFQNNVPSGTVGNNTIIENYNGEAVWIKPTSGNRLIWFNTAHEYITFSGINCDGTLITGYPILLDDNYPAQTVRRFTFQDLEVIGRTGYGGGQIHDVVVGGGGENTFTNLVVHGGGNSSGCGTNCSGYGFYVASSDNVFEGFDIYDTTSAGFHVYSTGQATDNNTIRNGRIHDITRTEDYRCWGVLLSGDDNLVYNVIVYGLTVAYSPGSGNAAFHAYAGDGNKFYNNTASNNVGQGIHVTASCSNTEVINNIAYGNGDLQYQNLGSSTTWSTNLDNGTTNPNFVDAGSNNYQIQAGSPAVDAGTTLGAVPVDFLNFTRPQGSAYCIGAYEYAVSTPGWSVIVFTGKGTPGATETVTIDACNTTGSNLYIASCSRFTGGSTDLIIEDSVGNSGWVELTDRVNGNDIGNRMFYCPNPITSPSYTCTIRNNDFSIYPIMNFLAVSGAIASPFGTQNGATTDSAVATLASGAVVPVEANTLIVTSAAWDNNTAGAVSVNLSFTANVVAYNGGVHEGGGMAYLVLGTAASKNPTWNLTNSSSQGIAASIAYFKSEISPTGTTILYYYQMVGRSY